MNERDVELGIVGCASAEPNPGGASSCYLLDAGKGQMLLECGHGASSKLLLQSSLKDIGAILISHMHPDHFFDLVPLKYFVWFHRRPRIKLYLPPTGPKVLDGIASALGETMAFWEQAYDVSVFDPDSPLELLGMRVEMQPTHHFVPAWAMRISSTNSNGGVIAYTSDTSFTDSLVSFVKNADLLLAETAIEHQKLPASEQGHLTPAEAGKMAHDAGVRQLVITHYPAAKAENMLAAAAHAFGGPVELAVEGARYVI